MNMIEERAYAKLNLTLGVLYKRADGYHALDTLMQEAGLFDTVQVERASGVTVTCAGQSLPYRNTARTAAERYEAITGRGARIHIVKRIPAEAGLGGGSADAAAVLRAMEKLYGMTGRAQLMDLALSVGADVPFCMQGGLCRAEGIGEILTPLAGRRLHFAIAKPTQGVSTKALFSALKLPREKPNTTAAMAAIAAGETEKLGSLLCNALEAPAVALVPEIGQIKARMLAAGAQGACMTGSGSAVFGLFSTAEAAQAAADTLSDLPFSVAADSVQK